MPTATQTCACAACQCEVIPTEKAEANGQVYCSNQCAEGHKDGHGCGHPGCDCQ